MTGLDLARRHTERRDRTRQRNTTLFTHKGHTTMKILEVTATIQGAAPLTWGAPITSTKESGEGHDKFEDRTWQERAHIDKNGHAYIISLAIKNCLVSVAQYLSESVPGGGAAKFTKHVTSGVLPGENMTICNLKGKPLTLADLTKYTMFVPADGKRGGSTRVRRSYPTAMEWQTDLSLIVVDKKIDAERIERYLKEAGLFIGLGSFRPQNNGIHGRFKVTKFNAVSKELGE